MRVCASAAAAALALSWMIALAAPTQARGAGRHHAGGKRVAYDAKDRRYYSVAWARAHHMRDRGGDRLVIVPLSSLPRGARMSRVLHGRM